MDRKLGRPLGSKNKPKPIVTEVPTTIEIFTNPEFKHLRAEINATHNRKKSVETQSLIQNAPENEARDFSELIRIRKLQSLLNQFSDITKQFNALGAPVMAVVDMPFREWPTVLDTDLSQKIDHYLKNSPLRLGLAEIVVAVKRAQFYANTPDYIDKKFSALNRRDKTRHLKSVLLKTYMHDCNVIYMHNEQIPWKKVSVQGWPEDVPKTIGHLTEDDCFILYRAYTEGNIKFTNK